MHGSDVRERNSANAPSRAETYTNLGNLLGLPILNGAGVLADADLDCKEAILLAPQFLPSTGMRFGRKSAPASHWVYCVDVPIFVKFTDPLITDKESPHHTLVELRAKPGEQTVFPPSIHPSGEPVEFVGEMQAPDKVETDYLAYQVACLASCVLLARHWPGADSNVRTFTRLALIGTLARKWPVEDTRKFLTSLYSIVPHAHDPGDKIWDELNNTYANLEAGKEVTGIPKLKEYIDARVVDEVIDWLGFDLRKAGGTKANRQAARLFELLDTFDVFCTPMGEGFAMFDVNGHTECRPLNSGFFKGYLSTTYYDQHKELLVKTTRDDALEMLQVKARDKQREVFVRFGWSDDSKTVYLDLGDQDWRVVEINADGWKIITKSPVPFRRDVLMKPLPDPVKDGSIKSIEPLFDCVNAQNPGDRIGYISWALSAFHRHGDLPILSVSGTHGSGKTQSGGTLRRVTDNNALSTEGLPRDEHNLAIMAQNSAILAFDNVSSLANWLSDALCRMTKGAGFRTRTFYVVNESTAFCDRRSVVLTGITDVAEREDLADRTIAVELEAIEDRETELQLNARFQECWPGVLGALLDVVVYGLKHVDETPVDARLRLADFCQWAVACEGALVGLRLDDDDEKNVWTEGTFLKFYKQNKQETEERSA